VILLAWEMYHAVNTFGGLARVIPRMIEDFRQGLFVSGYTISLANAYIREGIPLWANITRYFWLALLLVFPAILGFKNLIQIRSLNDIEIKVTGGLAGTGLMLVVTALAAGMEELFRVLIYAPFFTVPVVVIFCYKLHQPSKKHSFIILAALLLVFSFPTFLAHNNTVGTNAYYAYEFSAYRWLKSQYGDEEQFYYAGGWFPLIYYYFDEESSCRIGTGFQWLADQTSTGYLKELQTQITTLRHETTESARVYVYNECRIRMDFGRFLNGENPAIYPDWEEFQAMLYRENLIYSNSHVQFLKVR
jgi:hypothetical protein